MILFLPCSFYLLLFCINFLIFSNVIFIHDLYELNIYSIFFFTFCLRGIVLLYGKNILCCFQYSDHLWGIFFCYSLYKWVCIVPSMILAFNSHVLVCIVTIPFIFFFFLLRQLCLVHFFSPWNALTMFSPYLYCLLSLFCYCLIPIYLFLLCFKHISVAWEHDR